MLASYPYLKRINPAVRLDNTDTDVRLAILLLPKLLNMLRGVVVVCVTGLVGGTVWVTKIDMQVSAIQKTIDAGVLIHHQCPEREISVDWVVGPTD